METRAHHVLIGAFMLLICIGGLLFGLWVAKVSLDQEFSEYEVVFNEAVSGLSKGAVVNFNGIQVGEVRALSLDPLNPSRVLARIRVDAKTPVRSDTQARLTYTGLTGVVIVELVAGAVDAPPLVVAEGATLGRIMAQPSALQRFMTGGGDVLAHFNAALVQIGKVLDDDNALHLRQTLAHVDSIAAQLDADGQGVADLLKRADAAFTRVDTAAADVRDFARHAESTLANADALLASDLKPAAADLQAAVAAFKALSTRLDRLFARHGGGIDSLIGPGLSDLTATLAEMRVLAEGLNRIAGRLQTAPADYLLQRDRPREYRFSKGRDR